MSNSEAAIAGRELGALPLSVGTSLALEALQTQPTLKYECLYVNLQTVFRNLYQSLPKLIAEGIELPVWLRAFTSELLMIQRVCSELRSTLKIVYYLPSYDRLDRDFRGALLRPARTDNQKAYAKLQQDVLSGLKPYMTLLQQHRIYIELVDTYPPRIESQALMLTSFMVDLVQSRWDTRLLESHTGAIKDRSHWHTKFAGSADSSMMPFNKLTLSILGDNSLFAPHPVAVRKALYALAEEKNWHPLVTYDYVKYSVSSLKDPGLRDFFRTLF